MADVGFDAARPDLVVVRQIDIEDEFFGNGAEGGGFPESLAVAWIRAVDGADFKAGGVE